MATLYLFNMKTGTSEGTFEYVNNTPAYVTAGECLGDWILDGICDTDDPDDYGLYYLEIHKLNDVRFRLAAHDTSEMRHICKKYIREYGDN